MGANATRTYQKLKRAANKHYIACIHLQLHLETGSKNENQITNTLFYLSGYILECIFKSAILEATHKKGNLSLNELGELGLKTHDIKLLWKEVRDKTTCDTGKLKWTSLYNKWNSEIRYEADNSEFNDKNLVLHHFKETVLPIYKEIKTLY